MIVLGITGGVGSGKSAVLEYIAKNYNAKLIFCDDLAKELVRFDYELKNKIYDAFSPERIFDENGNIINNELSKIVFNDKKKLDLLNSIVHPIVKKKVISLIKSLSKENKNDAIIIEAALLLEENYDELFDCIYIYASENIRIKRLSESRGYSKEKALSIMNNQLDEEVFRSRCKYVIDNNSSFEDTCKNVDELLNNVYSLRRKNVRK